MPDAKTLEAYIELATAYVAVPAEDHLVAADALGNDLLRRHVALKELANLNHAALDRLLDTCPDTDSGTVVSRCSKILERMLAIYDNDAQERSDELVRIDEDLREREMFLRSVIDAAPAAINIKDSDGKYVLANQQLSGLFGVTPAELIGQVDEQKERLDYTDVDGMDDNTYVIETGKPVLVREGEYLMKGERSVWLSSKAPIKNSAGEVTHVATVAIDITERKRAEEELRESEQQFRRIVEAHPLPVWLVDIGSGQVLYESPAAAELLGLEWPAKVQRNVIDYYADPDDRGRYLKQIQETGEVRDLEFQIRRADDTVIWVSLTSRLLSNQEPRIAITSMIDLTERLAFEEELERQRDVLHQNEKMSAMGELLASVAHELNNPLSVVVGQSLLLMESAVEERIRGRAERIGNAAERCARIVKTFLAMARQQPAISEPIDVNEAIEVALEVCAYDLSAADVDVSLHLSRKLPPVAADFDQISQVVSNLIVNAQHALEGSEGERRLRVTSSHHPSTGEVVIKVKDSGPGIPSEIRNRIFEPFFTTKGLGKGTGIGLALCHRIVASHGGRIKLDDNLKDGTAFIVKLPRYEAKPTGKQLLESKTANRHALRILAIDDEQDMTELVADILRLDSHVVETANSGAAALERLASQHYDVILSDLRMPGLDGPSLFRHLETHRPELVSRVAFITGDTLSGEIRNFLTTSKRPYLEKPASPADIRALVHAVAEQSGTAA